MSLFAVTREAGPSWTDGKGAFEQPAVNDHAAFMNGLAEDGLVLFAGPLAGSEHDRIRVRRAVESSRRRRARRRTASGSVSVSLDVSSHSPTPPVQSRPFVGDQLIPPGFAQMIR